MKFCANCGKDMNDETVVCPQCGAQQPGAAQPNVVYNAPANPVDNPSFGYALLGFCIPIVGLILYLIWKDSTPNRAKSAGKGALISVILSVVVYIIYFVILGVFLAAL